MHANRFQYPIEQHHHRDRVNIVGLYYCVNNVLGVIVWRDEHVAMRLR